MSNDIQDVLPPRIEIPGDVPVPDDNQDVPPPRIEIPGDVLVLDEEFCEEVLGGAHRKTGNRYEAEGLPFVILRGRKWRPLHEGRRWVAARIQRLGQPPKRQRA